MTYVVTATWRAREGEEERVAQILRDVAAASRAEAGCLAFNVHRSVEHPRTFMLYEQFRDQAAFQAHNEAEHFKRLVLGEAVPRLELRERAFFELLDEQ